MTLHARRLVVALMLFVASSVALQTGGEGIAAAEPDLGLASDVVYTVDPAASAVHVVSSFVVSELKPDSKSGYFYFTGFTGYAEAAVMNLVVSEGGKPLPFTTEVSGKFQRVDVTFARRLRYQKPQTIVFTYDLASNPPRTSGNASRVNAAYASFPVFAFGMANASSVEIVAPATFQLDIQGTAMTQSSVGDNTVASSGNVQSPDAFYAFVAARNDANLSPTEVTVDSNPFQIRSWPGDTEWAAFVSQHVTTGVPQLEQLVGQPWPEAARTTDVHEAYTPYLYGYAGWFDAQKDSIEIGENLDDNVVYHELSHAWFNNALFSDRWINEGMAQEYASRAVAALGGSLSDPEPSDPTVSGAVPLATWSNPTSDHADAAEAFGYNASWQVIRTITDEIGIDKMKLVIAAAEQRTPAYGQARKSDLPAQVSDWKRFLDLVDSVGGATTADEAFSDDVVTDADKQVLSTRAAARSAYATLSSAQSAVVAGGTWTTPPAVQDSMESWTFDAATTAMAQASDTLVLVPQIAAITIDGRAPDLTAIHDAYVAAANNSQLAAVVASAHRQLEDRRNAAAAVVAKIAAEKAAAEAKVAADTAAAKQALAGAVDARRRAGGLFDTVGLWGSDVDAHIAAARQAMEAGRFDTVMAESATAMSRLDEAPGTGQQRLGLAGGGLVAVIAALLGVALLARRRRRRTIASTLEDNHRRWAAPTDTRQPRHVAASGAPAGTPPPASVPSPVTDEPLDEWTAAATWPAGRPAQPGERASAPREG